MASKGMNLLLAGLAAYGFYRFSKMTPVQKNELKQKARKFVDDNFTGLGNIFGKKTTTGNSRS